MRLAETPQEFAMRLAEMPGENSLETQFAISEPELSGRINTDYRTVESLKNFLSINGFDRDWLAYRTRYEYTIDLLTRFRNVRELKATSLIIPMEIHERKTLNMIMKTNFVHDYGLMYPYLILNVEEATGVYSGTNSAVQRAFAKFVYDSSYRSPNGRGYMIMRPIQDEAKVYRPAPLASLTSMMLSIRKPNGTLYNNSIDDFGIAKIEHEVWNNMYLKIVLDKYFDRNEFYIGDSILVRNFKFQEIHHPQNHQNSRGLESLVEFMNRREGHEIVEIGQANSQGFHNNFYVLAPGELDQLKGHVELNIEGINALRAWNSHGDHHGDHDEHDENTQCREERHGEKNCTEDSLEKPKHSCHVRPPKMGDIINASLQNVASFTVTTFEGDVSCLGVSLIGTGG